MKLYSKLLSHKALSNFRIQGYISETFESIRLQAKQAI